MISYVFLESARNHKHEIHKHKMNFEFNRVFDETKIFQCLQVNFKSYHLHKLTFRHIEIVY